MIAYAVPIECAKPAQTVWTTRVLSRPFPLGEKTYEPLLGSLEVLPVFVVKTNHEAKDEGEWGLEWAVVGESGGGNDEQVEEETKCSETDDDTGDSLVDEEEVVGEGITEEEEGSLEHQGQTFHDEIKVPGDHSVHLALSMSTTVNDRSTHLHLGISVKPLFAQHGYERGEEGSGQTRVKDSIDVDSSGIGASPLREGGCGTGWMVPKRGVGDDHKELIAHSLVIRLKTALNVDDESGCDRGEQTGLPGKHVNAAIEVDEGTKHSRRSRWYSSLLRIYP